MTNRVAGSILQLFAQVNTFAPNRDKGSDGTFPSAEHHAQNPGSDHEAHVVPWTTDLTCTAGDFTHDPTGGFNAYTFAEALRLARDPLIKYVISRDKMFSSYKTSTHAPWTWRPYSGTIHSDHTHVSVLDDKISGSRTPWNLEYLMATQLDGVIFTILNMIDPGNPTGPRVPLHVWAERMRVRQDAMVAQIQKDLADIRAVLVATPDAIDLLTVKQGVKEALKEGIV